MRIIIFIALIVAFIVGILLFTPKEPNKEKNTVKCSCGHEFKYKHKDIIKYKFSGRLHKEVECPKCKKYIDIDHEN